MKRQLVQTRMSANGACKSEMPRTIKVKPLSEIQANYEESGRRAADRYEKAVERNTDQHERAFSDSAEKNYSLAVTEAARLKTRQKKGREKSSQAFWKAQSKDKGVPALAAAIPLSGPKMARGYTPIREALDGLTIPDKTTSWEDNVDKILKLVIRTQRIAAGKE